MSVCEHGNLKRQCLICELQDELHESRQECMRLSGVIGKLSGELASILDESKRGEIKATLEFDLPECAEEHQTALNGWRWKKVVTDFEKYLHGLENTNQNPPVDEIRNRLFRIANENGVQIWE